MERKQARKLHKRTVMIAFCVLLLASLSVAVYAAYTNQGYKKGVLSTDRGAVRFSSDVLLAYSEGGAAASKTQLVSFTSAETTQQASFSIFNFPFGNPLQYNSENIVYDITFEIIGSETAPKPKVQVGSSGYEAMTGMTKTLRHTLNGGEASSISYYVSFPGESIGEYQLQVTAVPCDSASKRAAQHQVLSCLYVPVLRAETQITELSATGEFTEERASHYPSEYHAFNYRIALQNYTGTVSLSWNSKLQPDPFFLESLGIASNTGCLELSFSDETVNYEFVFYRTGVEFENPGSWDELDNCVSFSAINE